MWNDILLYTAFSSLLEHVEHFHICLLAIQISSFVAYSNALLIFIVFGLKMFFKMYTCKLSQ